MQKKVYFEWMRIIAIALVIFNHLPGYGLYASSEGMKQGIYMVITMITRLNVPLFFLISGALLLDKEEDYKKVFSKRISRFVLVILVFESALFILYLLKAVIKGDTFGYSFKDYLFGLFAGNLPGTVSYWFLYAYLGMLFMLPFLQRIAQKLNKQDFKVLLAVHFVFASLLPIINLIFSKAQIGTFKINASFNVVMATAAIIFYPLIGYYIDKKIDVRKLKDNTIVGLVLVAIIGIILSCVCTRAEAKMAGAYSQNYVQLFDYVTAIVVFILIKDISTGRERKHPHSKVSNAVCVIGSLTFGMYLLDPFIKNILYGTYENLFEPILPTIIVSLGWVIISMCIGGVITWGLKKIPFFKKIM